MTKPTAFKALVTVAYRCVRRGCQDGERRCWPGDIRDRIGIDWRVDRDAFELALNGRGREMAFIASNFVFPGEEFALSRVVLELSTLVEPTIGVAFRPTQKPGAVLAAKAVGGCGNRGIRGFRGVGGMKIIDCKKVLS